MYGNESCRRRHARHVGLAIRPLPGATLLAPSCNAFHEKNRQLNVSQVQHCRTSLRCTQTCTATCSQAHTTHTNTLTLSRKIVTIFRSRGIHELRCRPMLTKQYLDRTIACDRIRVRFPRAHTCMHVITHRSAYMHTHYDAHLTRHISTNMFPSVCPPRPKRDLLVKLPRQNHRMTKSVPSRHNFAQTE
jgi:hypothetical protein